MIIVTVLPCKDICAAAGDQPRRQAATQAAMLRILMLSSSAYAILCPVRAFGTKTSARGFCRCCRPHLQGDVPMITRRMALLDSMAIGFLVGVFPAFAAPRRSRMMQTLDTDNDGTVDLEEAKK